MEQRPKPTFAAIPDPTPDVMGLYKTVLAMKVAAEQIIGTRTGPDANERKASVFVTEIGTVPEGGMEGDLWLYRGETSSLSVRVGGQWKVIWE